MLSGNTKEIEVKNTKVRNHVMFLIKNEFIIEGESSKYHLIVPSHEIVQKETYTDYIDYYKHQIARKKEIDDNDKELERQAKKSQIDQANKPPEKQSFLHKNGNLIFNGLIALGTIVLAFVAIKSCNRDDYQDTRMNSIEESMQKLDTLEQIIFSNESMNHEQDSSNIE